MSTGQIIGLGLVVWIGGLSLLVVTMLWVSWREERRVQRPRQRRVPPRHPMR